MQGLVDPTALLTAFTDATPGDALMVARGHDPSDQLRAHILRNRWRTQLEQPGSTFRLATTGLESTASVFVLGALLTARAAELRHDLSGLGEPHLEFARGAYGKPLIAIGIAAKTVFGKRPEAAELPRPGAVMGSRQRNSLGGQTKVSARRAGAAGVIK